MLRGILSWCQSMSNEDQESGGRMEDPWRGPEKQEPTNVKDEQQLYQIENQLDMKFIFSKLSILRH